MENNQGNRIKQLRKTTHLSRRAFCLKHNISPGTLQNCEDGRYQGLTKKTALKLIRAFQAEGIGCQLDWLLYGKGVEPSSCKLAFVDNDKPAETEIDLLQEALQNEKRHQTNAKLFDAASSGRYHEIVTLVESGVDAFLYEGVQVKPYEREHNTPLHLTSLNGHAEIMKFLIKKGANVNSKNRKYQTPLHMAVYNAHQSIVEYLILHNANINALDSEGDTPLAWAAYRGQLGIAHQLIQLSANIHLKNNLGNTPLHWAAGEGHAEIVKLLVNQGADKKSYNDDNYSPLQLAVYRGKIEVVKFLLDCKI